MISQGFEWLSPVVTQHVALALLHFLWQGVLVAVAVGGILRLLRDDLSSEDEVTQSHSLSTRSSSRANLRYMIGCAGLLVMAALPVVNLFVVQPNSVAMTEAVAAVGQSTRGSSARGVGGVGATLGQAPGASLDIPASFEGDADATVGVTGEVGFVAESELESTAASRLVRLALQSFFWVWVVGVVVLSVWHVAAWVLSQRYRRQGVAVAAETQAVVQRVAQRLGIRRVIAVRQAMSATVPVVIGWVKPVLVFPASILTGLSPAELEAVLAHELAHVRRNDYLVNLVQAVIETVLFYHPAVWWLSRRVRNEREFCADDLAMGVCEGREVYAQSLVALAEMVRTVPAHAVAATGGRLVQRIRRVMRFPEQPSTPMWRIRSSLVAAAVLICLTGALAVAQIRTSRVEQPPLPADGDGGKNVAEPAAFGRIEARVESPEFRFVVPADPFAPDDGTKAEPVAFQLAAIQLRTQAPKSQRWRSLSELEPNAEGVCTFEDVPAGTIRLVPMFEPEGHSVGIEVPVEVTAGETTKVTFGAPFGDSNQLPVRMEMVAGSLKREDTVIRNVTHFDTEVSEAAQGPGELRVFQELEILVRAFDSPPPGEPETNSDKKPQDATASDSIDEATAKRGSWDHIDAALKQPCELEFMESPLQEVIEHLADRHRVPIVLDVRALEDQGVSVDAPVTKSIAGIPLDETLDYLMQDLNLTWCVKHNVVLITTRREVGWDDVRLYKLRGSRGMADLIQDIQANVSPESWNALGGPASLAPYASDVLVVRQSYPFQRQIQRDYAQWLQPVPIASDVVPPSLEGTRMAKQLNQITDLDVLDTPLKEVMDDLSKRNQVKIVLDELELAKVNIKPGTPISRSLGKRPLRSVLSLLVQDLDLAWEADKNEIRITLPSVTEVDQLTEHYLFNDLVFNGEMEPLYDLIYSTIQPHSWEHVGGWSNIRTGIHDVIVIRHSFAAHCEIHALLKGLREAKPDLVRAYREGVRKGN